MNSQPESLFLDVAKVDDLGAAMLAPLLQSPRSMPAPAPILGMVVGTLLALTDNGATPLVSFAGQAGVAAVAGRSTVDLHGAHIGQRVVLMFEQGDAARPIVMGVIQGQAQLPPTRPVDAIEMDVDGRRMLVTAQEQLVLKCGKASITLTQSGKVLIEGSHVLSRATGVNRVKGGSVQLN